MEVNEKNFFKKVWTSIRDFEEYEEFAAEKLSKAIKYIVIIILIFAIVVALIYTYKFTSSVKDIKNYINENINDISIIDGKLKINPEKEITIADENNIIPIIIVNTVEGVKKEEYAEKFKAYNLGVLVLSDRIVFNSNAITNMNDILYSSIFTSNIEGKEAFLELISPQSLFSAYALFYVTIFIYLFVIYLISNMIDIIILAVLGYLFARVMKIRLKFKATFNIGVHALTLPIILNLLYIIVNTFTGFTISKFQWMYTTISYIYVVVAILMIKTEIINQRIQLIRLKQIQEEVKEVTDEEEKQERTKEKEEKKQEDKEENTGEEPEGSNA